MKKFLATISAVMLHLAIGSIYAWSIIIDAVHSLHGWSLSWYDSVIFWQQSKKRTSGQDVYAGFHSVFVRYDTVLCSC